MSPTTPPLEFSNEIFLHNKLLDEQSSPKKSNFTSNWFNNVRKKDKENYENEVFDKAFEDMLESRDIPQPVRNQLRAMDYRKKSNMLKASEITPKSEPRKGPQQQPTQLNNFSPDKKLSNKTTDKSDSPILFAKMLQKEHSTTLDVQKVKRLRQLIRAESSQWLLEFFRSGGYEGLCESLSEILKVEWREEQHDDLILHELLRCFKGLSTSEFGLQALSSKAPEPYKSLMSLLFTDKKPGTLATRQLMMELFTLIFEIFDDDSSTPNHIIRSPTTQTILNAASNQTYNPEKVKFKPISVPYPYHSASQMVRQLILNPPNEAIENQHDFIKIAKRPRIYKAFLSEIYEIQRDFFWCFGHKNNGIWHYPSVDIRSVEKLRFRVPGGMTAGVEYEAIGYLTSIFALINAISAGTLKEGEDESQKLHYDLFSSGLDRYIYTSRQASLVHYPLLHYNLSLYLQLVKESKYQIPNVIQRFVIKPPENVRRKN